MYARLEAPKAALRLHADNAATIRATESAQKHPLGKAVKIGANKPMPPKLDGIASRAAIRFDPIKFAALIRNFIEFCTNEKYHL